MPNLIRMRAELARLKAAGAAKIAEYNALAARIAQMDAAASAEAEGGLEALAGEIDGLKGECDALSARIEAEERRAATFQTFAGQATAPRHGPRAPATPAANEPPAGDPSGGFASVAAFAASVRLASLSGSLDPRLAALPAGTLANCNDIAALTLITNGGGAALAVVAGVSKEREAWEADRAAKTSA